MLWLIADSSAADSDWRRMLRGGQGMVLGRGPDCDLVVDWDSSVSRRHLEIVADGTTAQVTRVPGSSNPVFMNGKEVENFHLTVEDSFVIGSTSFRSDSRW